MICKDCWKVFTANLFNSSLVDDETFESLLNDPDIKAIESSKLTQDEFDYLKKNKDKFNFAGRRKEYKDEIGFTKVEWA